MTQTLAIPLWLFVLIIALAMMSFTSNLLLPSVRWFFRRRVQRMVDRLNKKLDRPIDVFKLAERQDRIARLVYDPRVLEAVTDHAAQTGMPASVALQEARRYASEIVPGFSTTLYFGVAIKLARRLSRLLYDVRIGRLDMALRSIDPKATVIFVMNHRSNMDYVLVTWLVAGRATISFAVGEWAHVWPLSGIIRAMGAYFIRRNSRNALYRRVLARYVQMATDEGVTQAIFPEGGLSLDGSLGPAKLGLLSYIMTGFRPGTGRDVVFVPVGLNYDRVLEDRILTKVAKPSGRSFGGNTVNALAFAAGVLLRKITGRFKGFGTAAVAFGAPVSLTGFLAAHENATAEVLAAQLMAAIAAVIPVVPVPLVAAALLRNPVDRADLATTLTVMVQDLAAAGAVLKLKPGGIENTMQAGLSALIARGLVDANLQIAPGAAPMIGYYAASVSGHRPGTAAGILPLA